MRYLTLLLLVPVLFCFSSCNDKKGYTSAWIINTKDITNEGCGYILVLDNLNKEKPEYVPSMYQHDSMRVSVKYHPSGRLDTCNFSADERDVWNTVIIDEIEREGQ
jgi:hypothetical protein